MRQLPEPPPPLVRAFLREECIPFIGAGVSNQAKLPLWKDIVAAATDILVQNMRRGRREQDEQRFLNSASPLDVFERLKTTICGSEYSDFLRKQFARTVRPSKLHNLVARSPTQFFMTTNFDRLLEVALKSVIGHLPASCIRYEQVVAATNSHQPHVLHLHGSIQDLKSIVLGRNDYDALMTKQGVLLQYVRQILVICH